MTAQKKDEPKAPDKKPPARDLAEEAKRAREHSEG